jgi:hypothetical protein
MRIEEREKRKKSLVAPARQRKNKFFPALNLDRTALDFLSIPTPSPFPLLLPHPKPGCNFFLQANKP